MPLKSVRSGMDIIHDFPKEREQDEGNERAV